LYRKQTHLLSAGGYSHDEIARRADRLLVMCSGDVLADALTRAQSSVPILRRKS
jgi:hypothetical protein